MDKNLYESGRGVGPVRELLHIEDGGSPGVGGQEAGGQSDDLHAQPGQDHLVDPHSAGLIHDSIGRAGGWVFCRLLESPCVLVYWRGGLCQIRGRVAFIL